MTYLLCGIGAIPALAMAGIIGRALWEERKKPAAALAGLAGALAAAGLLLAGHWWSSAGPERPPAGRLDCIVTVYDAEGDILRSYSGIMDVEALAARVTLELVKTGR